MARFILFSLLIEFERIGAWITLINQVPLAIIKPISCIPISAGSFDI